MFDFPVALTPLHLYFQDNAQGLMHAAMTLGGHDWFRRVRKIIDELRQGGPLTRRTRIEIEKLYGLLTLRNVHDPDSFEAGFFDELSFEDPVLEEICLLTEQLEEVALEAGLNLEDPWKWQQDSCLEYQ